MCGIWAPSLLALLALCAAAVAIQANGCHDVISTANVTCAHTCAARGGWHVQCIVQADGVPYAECLCDTDSRIEEHACDTHIVLEGEGERRAMRGSGRGWRVVSGVGAYVVELPTHFCVVYHNNQQNSSIVHAHGMTPPLKLDGVPYISQAPLLPGEMQQYAYPLDKLNAGTYWLHSHFGFQAGEGLSAPFIVRARAPHDYALAHKLDEAEDAVLWLRDGCPYFNGGTAPVDACDAWGVYVTLKDAWDHGQHPSEDCPAPATGSDVLYRHHFMNGKTSDERLRVSVSQKYVRLRAINAAGMSNYKVDLGGLEGHVVAVDGQYVNPIKVKDFWIAVAQRVDILIEAEEIGTSCAKEHIITATSEAVDDPVSQSSLSLVFGSASCVKSAREPGPPTKPGFMGFDFERQLHAFAPLPSRKPDREYVVKLTGDNGFHGINNASYQLVPMYEPPFRPNPRPLRVGHGERVHLRIENHNADAHSMHLHGHQFQIVEIDGQPHNGALRDTVLLPGGCRTVVVAFDAVHPGVWPLHCHMEFHLAAGMLTTVEYLE
eukprot:CAMPEP_0177648414 /NCGR_PEP_ID=MMETSP0447-20121125/10813_1 /TAXON_ID=0 /ORGANISM="Stygamoeba regulata, Strain BSH-02190019" /LENGTH=546 /DNA_ID=CAMNT_0019151049 /DNA_START=97 /DNA_END=1737 /DNA_ORIENTATION=+